MLAEPPSEGPAFRRILEHVYLGSLASADGDGLPDINWLRERLAHVGLHDGSVVGKWSDVIECVHSIAVDFRVPRKGMDRALKNFAGDAASDIDLVEWIVGPT